MTQGAEPHTTEHTAYPGLRPRQREAMQAVETRLSQGVSRQLVVLPTGYGKTRLGLSLAQRFKRTLFLCPTLELEDQTLAAWRDLAPEKSHGRIKGAVHELGRALTVSTPMSLVRRLERVPPDAWDCVIVDEAHHAGANEQVRVLRHLTPQLRLGLTATPERYEGLPLDHLFEEIVYQRTLLDAVKDGVLVRPIGLKVSTRIHLEACARGGDYAAEDLARAINIPARNALVCETYLARASGRSAVGFTASIQHALDLAECFRAAGVRAEAVWGSDPQRSRKVAAIRDGSLQVLFNSNVLSEGFDAPRVSCILMVRPTQSRTRFVQQAGRGLRLAPGKRDCLVIVFEDEVRHRLNISLWDFAGLSGDAAPELSGETDLLQVVSQQTEIENRRQAVLEQLLRLDTLRGEVSELDLLAPPPERGIVRTWKGAGSQAPATNRQKAALIKLGFDPVARFYSQADASALIGTNHAQSPITPLMGERLRREGFDTQRYPWTFGQAEAALLHRKHGERRGAR